MKTAAGVVIVLSVISIIREAAAFDLSTGSIDNRQVAGLLFPLILFIYATTWFFALLFNTRGTIALTATSLVIPGGMIVFNIIAIGLAEPDVPLKVTIMAALGGGSALYVYIARRCWVRWRNRYGMARVQRM